MYCPSQTIKILGYQIKQHNLNPSLQAEFGLAFVRKVFLVYVFIALMLPSRVFCVE